MLIYKFCYGNGRWYRSACVQRQLNMAWMIRALVDTVSVTCNMELSAPCEIKAKSIFLGKQIYHRPSMYMIKWLLISTALVVYVFHGFIYDGPGSESWHMSASKWPNRLIQISVVSIFACKYVYHQWACCFVIRFDLIRNLSCGIFQHVRAIVDSVFELGIRCLLVYNLTENNQQF